ncbi:MAG: hypothetical protein ACTSP1_00480 [Candidatus Freyarchaeota archaeon]
MSFIEEPHFTRSRQRFRLLSLNSDKLIQLVLEVLNRYKDGGFNRQEFFRDIRDRQQIDLSNLDKEFVEELENGAGIIYMRGKYHLNMTRLLMLMNMFLKEIERVDRHRADDLRQRVNQIHEKIKTITGESGVPEKEAEPKLPTFEEIEEEEPTIEKVEVEPKTELESVDRSLISYIKEYDKLSIIQISSALGVPEDEIKRRLKYMLGQGLLVGTIQGDYFIREAVSTVTPPRELGAIEPISEVKEPITLETTPAEPAAEPAPETVTPIKEPVAEERVVEPAAEVVEAPAVEEPSVSAEEAVVEEPAAEVVEAPAVEEPATEIVEERVVEPAAEVVEAPAVEEPSVSAEEAVVEEPAAEAAEAPVAEITEEPVAEAVEEAPPEVVYSKKDVKEIYKRMKLFIELVSQILEMVVVPDRPGFTREDLYKLVYDYYFLPIDGSFDVEPFEELEKEGAVRVDEEWIRIDLGKVLSLFKDKYIPGIRKVKKKTAEKLEKALEEHIERLIDDLLGQHGG